MIPSEEELIRATLQGQKEAFGQLFERYQKPVYNLVFRITGKQTETQDIVQETFMLAFSRLETYQIGGRFSAWIYRIAYNQTMDYFREHKRETANMSLENEKVATGFELSEHRHDQSPDYHLETIDQYTLLMRALDELQPEYKTIILLKEQQGLSYEEIGDIMDSPVGTVRSRLHRARMELKEKLDRLERLQNENNHLTKNIKQ